MRILLPVFRFPVILEFAVLMMVSEPVRASPIPGSLIVAVTRAFNAVLVYNRDRCIDADKQVCIVSGSASMLRKMTFPPGRKTRILSELLVYSQPMSLQKLDSPSFCGISPAGICAVIVPSGVPQVTA